MAGFMVTSHGCRYVFASSENELLPEEIALVLSRIPRFGGHLAPSIPTYTVAQHSVLVSQLVPDEMQLAALLHDAHEVVTGDIITPLQIELDRRIPGFRKILLALQREVQQHIHRHFDLPDVLPADWEATIHEADIAVLRMERAQVLEPSEWVTNWFCDTMPIRVQYPATHFEVWAPARAESIFLDRLATLRTSK